MVFFMYDCGEIFLGPIGDNAYADNTSYFPTPEFDNTQSAKSSFKLMGRIIFSHIFL